MNLKRKKKHTLRREYRQSEDKTFNFPEINLKTFNNKKSEFQGHRFNIREWAFAV